MFRKTYKSTDPLPLDYNNNLFLKYKRFMFAIMIAYCTDMSLKKCTTALGVGYHSAKCRMMTSVVVMKTKRKAPSESVWYLMIILRFKRLFANGDDANNLI